MARASGDGRVRPAGRPRIAVAHDWLCGLRGGERVLDRLCRLVRAEYQSAGLYALFDDRHPLTPDIDALRPGARVSPLNRLPGGAARWRRWLLPLYPMAVEALSRELARDHARDPIDLVISTSSAAIKGLRPPSGVPHLCYCHSPARYLWAQGGEYARASAAHALGLGVMGGPLRAWDRATAQHVTRFIANSSHIAGEIRRVYGVDAQVVWPPVRTEYFTPDSRPREGFWLVAGALEPYKRVDVALGAARELGREVVVVGEGSMRPRLEREFGGSARFLGRVPDGALRDLFRAARCLVFPQVEDFGITAVEAMACGCPVLALGEGGAVDIVRDGGAHFTGRSAREMAEAEARLPKGPEGESVCRREAERFSEARFDREMRAQIESMLGS